MKVYLPFLLGYLAHGCVLSLYMDHLGKEGTIKSISESWIQSAITIPIAFVILGASLAGLMCLSIWWGK